MWLKKLERLLSPLQRQVIGAITTYPGSPVYLVGGPVRDLLLGRRILDVDLVVEGSATPLVRFLAEKFNGSVTEHPKFGTAKIAFAGGEVVDIAESRREVYPEPARLPVVQTGATVLEDMARRDFSINAMALRVSGDGAGTIVDPFDGQADLDRSVVRILHPMSFRDDPVRAFRALRYAIRYGFDVDRDTITAMRALRRDPILLRTASDRIFDEWKRAFDEPRWFETLEDFIAHGLLRWVGFSRARPMESIEYIDEEMQRICAACPGLERWSVRWLAFLALYPDTLRVAVAAAMPFTRAVKKIFACPVRMKQVQRMLNATVSKPSVLTENLSRLPPEWLAVLSALSGNTGRRRIRLYVSRWSQAAAPATGDDLKAWGIPPGPAYPNILRKLRAAHLDGDIKTRAQARQLAMRIYKKG